MKKVLTITLLQLIISFGIWAHTQQPVALTAHCSEKISADAEIELFIKAEIGSLIQVDFGDRVVQNGTMNGEFKSFKGMVSDGAKIQIKGNAQSITGVIFNNAFLSKLDISELTNLEELYASKNQLMSINTSHNIKLQTLDLSNNDLLRINVIHNIALKELFLNNNNLQELDITNNPNLDVLHCTANHITQLSTGNNQHLKQLYCNNNKLSVLNLAHNKQLEVVECKGNLLSDLNISENTDLVYVAFCFNQIGNFEANNHPKLLDVWCAGNLLKTLDLSQCGRLCNLYCPNNLLTFNMIQLPNEASVDWFICEQSLDLTEHVTNVTDEKVYLHLPVDNNEVSIIWQTIDGYQLIEGVDYTVFGNNIHFQNNLTTQIYCEITHPEYGNMVLKSQPMLMEVVAIDEIGQY